MNRSKCDSETMNTTGIGFVSFVVKNKKVVSVDPEEVTPDTNGNIAMTVTSDDPGVDWHFRDPHPIEVDHPRDFTVGPGGGTVVNVHDTSADKHVYPTHHYTAFFESSRGDVIQPDALEFDPVIKDHN